MITGTFKAIVVDDERITRKGLIDYIRWYEFNIEIVGEASDGQEGLELAEKIQPDIMLCDVRMPRMDGIALAKKVKEILPSCKIIFLSAYSDIEYLKSAIQLKAIDYVEKPVNLKEFTELIERTMLLCKEERERRYREQKLMVKVEKITPYLRYKLLLNLIGLEDENANGIKIAAELAAVELPDKGRYVCCVLNTPDKENLEKILHSSTEILKTAKVQTISGEIKQQLVFVCYMEEEVGLHRITSVCEEILGVIKEDYGANASIGIGALCDCVNDVREAFRQASEAAAYYFFKGIDNVILYNDIRSISKHRYTFNKVLLSTIEKHIMERNFNSSLKILDNIVDDMKNGDISDIENIKQELFKVYLTVSKVYSDLVLQPENRSVLTKLFAEGDIFSIRNFIANSIKIVEESIKSAGDNKYNFVIKEVEAYIQKNYSNNITIAEIAKAVYLTPTYLCALFKKEKGETINDYITKIRIQNAIWLLKDQKLKLYEISQKVGYDDPNYFAKVFKKITGNNPSEYRDMV